MRLEEKRTECAQSPKRKAEAAVSDMSADIQTHNLRKHIC